MADHPDNIIAFQGQPGAYSHLACRQAYPELRTLPCESFEEAFEAVESGRARLAMIPIENSVAGRVAEIHRILPYTALHIVGEHYQRVRHHLLAVPGAKLEGIKTATSHLQALTQCQNFLKAHKLKAVAHIDTAGAAADVARRKDPTEAAIASSLAGEIYKLQSLRADIEDAQHNTTRFIVLSRTPLRLAPNGGLLVTSFVFRVRNVPAALYKALGGFATNGVNMTKLESYMIGGGFSATQFHADIEGHPDSPNVKLALEELNFFSREVRILGTYPAHPFRSGSTAAG